MLAFKSVKQTLQLLKWAKETTTTTTKTVRHTNGIIIIKWYDVFWWNIWLLVLSRVFLRVGSDSHYISFHLVKILKHKRTHFASRLYLITGQSLNRFAWLKKVAFHFMLLSTMFFVFVFLFVQNINRIYLFLLLVWSHQ